MLSSSSSSSRKLSENSCRSSNVGAYFGFIWAIIITLIIYYSLTEIEKSKCNCAKIHDKDFELFLR